MKGAAISFSCTQCRRLTIRMLVRRSIAHALSQHIGGVVFQMQNGAQSGYTLAEVAVVCAVGTVLLAIAFPLFNSAITRSNSNAAAQLIAQELGYARALAVGSHAGVLLEIDPANETVVTAPGTGSARGPFRLPGRMRIQGAAFTPDTPDGLNALVLGSGNNTQMTFLDNGAVVDNPTANNIISGTFYLQDDKGDPATRRAVTVIGGTGRIHMWRYDSQSGSWK